MINKSYQAPYDKGSEAIVNTSVRNTWELDPASFYFEEADCWERWLSNLKYQITAQLGLAGMNIHAELYKMLI